MDTIRATLIVFLLFLISGSTHGQQSNILVGTGVCGFSGDGGAAELATICNPYILEPQGSAFVFVDFAFMRIREFVPNGLINTIPGGADVPNPAGLAILGNDTYVTDMLNHHLYRIDTNGDTSIVAGNGGNTANTSGPALDVPIGRCLDIDTDGEFIYLGDLLGRKLLKYDPLTEMITVLYTSPSGITGLVIVGNYAYLRADHIIEVNLTTLESQSIWPMRPDCFLSYNDGLLYTCDEKTIISIDPSTGDTSIIFTEPDGTSIYGIHATGSVDDPIITYCVSGGGS